MNKFKYILQFYYSGAHGNNVLQNCCDVAVKLNEKEEMYARENKGRRKSSSL